MATELENSIRAAAEKVAQYIADAATMTVETRYVEVGATGPKGFEDARPAAQTVVKLDGDSFAVVPLRTAQTGGLEVDTSLFEVHERNVATTIEYRQKILGAVLGILQNTRR